MVQRLGLTFLKAKVAAWRYQRGSRSLALNLDETKATNTENPKSNSEKENAEDDEDYDIPDDIEEVLEYLLEGLRSPETVIR